MSQGLVKYDKHYAESERACGGPFAPLVEFARSLEHKATVLDLGCGQGRDSLLFARAGHRVVGIDVSRVGVAQLSERAREEALDLTASVGDVQAFETEETFDVVILDRVLHMLSDNPARMQVLDRACRATASGGSILISEYPKQVDLLRGYFSNHPRWKVFRDSKGFVFVHKEVQES